MSAPGRARPGWRRAAAVAALLVGLARCGGCQRPRPLPPDPMIALQPSVEVQLTPGQPDVAVTVANSGGAGLTTPMLPDGPSYTEDEAKGWLAISRVAVTSVRDERWRFRLCASTALLAAGDYHAYVVVKSDNALAKKLAVTLHVAPGDPAVVASGCSP